MYLRGIIYVFHAGGVILSLITLTQQKECNFFPPTRLCHNEYCIL